MTDVRALQGRLEDTFRGAFHVRDVAEALLSFDAQMPAATAEERLGRRSFVVTGVHKLNVNAPARDGCVLFEQIGNLGDERRELRVRAVREVPRDPQVVFQRRH